MTTTIWNLTRAIWGLAAGRSCRSCGQSILPRDAYGMSEGVCQPCRVEANSPTWQRRTHFGERAA